MTRLVAVALLSVVFWGPLRAQLSQSRAVGMRLDDTTNYVDVPAFNIRITYPRPDSTWDRPLMTDYDGLQSVSLAESVYVSFETRVAIKTHSDSMAVRKHAPRFWLNIATGPETPARFDSIRAEFRMNSTNATFDEYLKVNGRKFGVRILRDGDMPKGVEFVTFFKRTRVGIAVAYGNDAYTESASTAIYDSTAREDSGSVKKIHDAFQERFARYLTTRAMHTFNLIRLAEIEQSSRQRP